MSTLREPDPGVTPNAAEARRKNKSEKRAKICRDIDMLEKSMDRKLVGSLSVSLGHFYLVAGAVIV